MTPDDENNTLSEAMRNVYTLSKFKCMVLILSTGIIFHFLFKPYYLQYLFIGKCNQVMSNVVTLKLVGQLVVVLASTTSPSLCFPMFHQNVVKTLVRPGLAHHMASSPSKVRHLVP